MEPRRKRPVELEAVAFELASCSWTVAVVLKRHSRLSRLAGLRRPAERTIEFAAAETGFEWAAMERRRRPRRRPIEVRRRFGSGQMVDMADMVGMVDTSLMTAETGRPILVALGQLVVG